MLDQRLSDQKSLGSDFFVGDQLIAVDIYWATFAALLEPMSHDLCAMPKGIRQSYGGLDEKIASCDSAQLIQHRDFIYKNYLSLPMDF